MIYLDTHVVLWLYVDERNKLSDFVQSIVAQEFVLVCSSIVRLELQYLYEIGRLPKVGAGLEGNSVLKQELYAKPAPTLETST